MQQLIDSAPIRTIMAGKRRNVRGRLMCLTMVALVIMMGLTGIYGSNRFGPRDAAAHADDWYTLAHYGTAKVDGVVEDGEYGEILGPGDKDPASGCLSAIQAEYHFTLCETNDDANAYYAFIIDDLTLPPPGDPGEFDLIHILFDDDHDGSVACPHAEDGIAVAPVPGPAIFDLTYCGAFDNLSGDAQTDGSGAFTFTPGVGYVYEMAHPLNSGDPADFELALHDTVGYCAVYIDTANPGGEVEFPALCFGIGNGQQYGDVFLKGKYDELLAKLRALVDSCEPCPPEEIGLLEEDIDLAIQHYTRNDEGATAQALNAFVTKVDRGMQSGMLPEDVGRQLIAEATPLIEKLAGAQAETKKAHDSGTETKKQTKKQHDSRHGHKKAHDSRHGGKNAHAHSQHGKRH